MFRDRRPTIEWKIHWPLTTFGIEIFLYVCIICSIAVPWTGTDLLFSLFTVKGLTSHIEFVTIYSCIRLVLGFEKCVHDADIPTI